MIIARECEELVTKPSVVRGLPSDHFAVKCDLSVKRPNVLKQTVRFRKLRAINLKDLSNDILSSDLSESTGDLTCLVEKYNTVLRKLMDKHAPEVERKISLRPPCSMVQ